MAAPRISYDLDGPDKSVIGEKFIWVLKTTQEGTEKAIDMQEAVSAKCQYEDPTRGLMEIKKTETGIYAFEFVPPVVGLWQLKMIRGKGVALFAGNTITTDVLAEVPDSDIKLEFEISGDSLTACRLGNTARLNIIAVDRISNCITDVDPAEFKISIFGNGRKTIPKIIHISTGTYAVEFEAQSPGYYTATLIYDGVKVLKQKIVFSEIGNARTTTLSNLPPNRVPKKTLHQFKLQVKDMHGNIPGVGGDPIEFGISDGPATATHVKVIDHENGTYTLEFELPVEGPYMLRVRYDGEHLKQSPWKIQAF